VHDMHMFDRGSASSGAPVVFRPRWRLAIALALALDVLPGVASAAAAPLPLRFGDLAWDAPPEQVARALASSGFSRLASEPGEEPRWRGGAFGRRAVVVADYGSSGGLVAVTLRFEPDARGSALQRYAELVERLRRRHGAWTVRVAPGRPVVEERLGRYGVTRRMGERSAATLWTNDAGEAAVVQLDRDDVLWLRFESPRWEAEAGDGAAGPPGR
jgi:hypothetical protein